MEKPEFKDHFSGHAGDYSKSRPGYPPELFSWLASQTSSHEAVWDCATGNGQAARALIHHFDKVYATDASPEQIESADPCDGIEFSVAKAEESGLNNSSVDLITVAQAMHWFDFDAFYSEVKRVAKPGAILAAWTYQLAEVNPEIDRIIFDFYKGPIDRFWPPEREYVEAGYATIPFPFEKLEVPQFTMRLEWAADDMLAYLRTWSAVKRFSQTNPEQEPVGLIEDRLKDAWGSIPRLVEWPLAFLVGKVE